MKKKPRPVSAEGPYRVSDLAQLLDCSGQGVRHWFHRRMIPGAFRVGKLIRFDRARIDAWIEERKRAAAAVYDVPAVAGVARLPEYRVGAMAHAGEIPGLIGRGSDGRLRFDKATVDAWIASRSTAN